MSRRLLITFPQYNTPTPERTPEYAQALDRQAYSDARRMQAAATQQLTELKYPRIGQDARALERLAAQCDDEARRLADAIDAREKARMQQFTDQTEEDEDD